MEGGSGAYWIPIIILFRLGFRLATLLNPVLGLVFFYNVPLFINLPRFVVLAYPILMGILEVYLLVVLRKGRFPAGLLFAYFVIAIVFEFPYGVIRSEESGLVLFGLL